MVSSNSSRGSVRMKKRSKRKGIQRAAVVQTSLPPQVDGQIRCFLVVKITKILWKMSSPPAQPLLRVKWWGELTDGTIFSPAQNRVCARYAVRSGPKQFVEYLTDMGTLVMEVVDGSSMTLMGKVQVYGLNALTAERPIVGPYPIFSSKADILGHVTVNISIQSLNVFDDSSSTAVPTTDLDTSDARSLSLRRTNQLESHDNQDMSVRPQINKRFTDEGPVLNKKFPSPKFRRKSGGFRSRAEVQARASVTDTEAYSDAKDDIVSLLLARGERLKAAMTASAVDHMLPAERFVSTNLGAQSGSSRLHAPVYSGVDQSWAATEPKSHLPTVESSGFKRSPVRARRRPAFEQAVSSPDRIVQLLFGDSVLSKSDILPELNMDLTDDDRSVSDEFAFDQSGDSDHLHDEELVEMLFYGKQKSSADASSDSDSSLLCASASRDIDVDRPMKTAPGFSERLSHTVESSARLDGQFKGVLHDRTAMTEHLGGRQQPAVISDSTVTATAAKKGEADRSDSSSHVSFDLAPSDEDDLPNGARRLLSPAPQLDAQQLTLLGQVKVARVCVDSLVLKPVADVSQPVGKQPAIRRLENASRKRGHNKPPAAPPLSTAKGVQVNGSNSGTYFIEYQFPVAAASRDSSETNATATETVRAVSRKWDVEAAKNGDIVFANHAVFPTFFDGNAVKRWWSSVLVFRVFSRPVGEKMALPFGTASLPMQSILQSPSFNFSGDLEVMSNSFVGERLKGGTAELTDHQRLKSRRPRTASAGCHSRQGNVLGLLKVKIELTSDSTSFAAALREYAQTREQAAKIARLMRPPVASNSQEQSNAVTTSEEHNHHKEAELPPPLVVRAKPVPRQEVGVTSDQVDAKIKLPTDTGVPVHVLLHVTCGRGFDGAYDHSQGNGSASGPNLYVVCRGFWDEADSLHSSVCWNSANPTFSLLETIPVWITEDVLLRLKNNFMIIEVWLKKNVLASSDELVGLVRVPLNILYASFRDRRISQLLLKSEYPVICVDNYMPVTCPFTGDHRGELHVLLAAGSRDQITDIQAAKSCRETSAVFTYSTGALKEGHASSRSAPVDQSAANQSAGAPANTADLEHLYEIVVGEIRSFTPSDDMLWGEADCFVQYHFPTQDCGTLLTKAFRTSTVLCVPNPTFDFKTTHVFRLPSTAHVQASLLKAAGGAASGSCIPFEIWARFYHPNVRDQVLARGRLPLAKLCALATMQQQNSEDCVAQASFTVPLSPATGCGKVGSAGLLDVSVSYKRTQYCRDSRLASDCVDIGSGYMTQLSMTAVTIRLSVRRACGLQSATRALARKHKTMEYFSQVGPNVFVKVTLGNVGLAAQEFRVSPTVARNFCPEFQYYADFRCPVVSSNGTSLAESLESAQAVVELWHQAEHEVAFGNQSTEADVLLGIATVPLRALVTHKTGITGWFPVTAPLGVVAVVGDPLYGGLEVEVKFANSFDRQIVIDAGNKIGWLIPGDSVDNIIAAGPSDRAQSSFTIDVSSLRVSADIITPTPEIESLLSASPSKTACYVKYTFFDADTFYSEPLYLEKDGQYTCSRKRVSETFRKLITPPLLWFLHENQLEIQLWLTYINPNSSEIDVDAAFDNQFAPPYATDRYLGSAYVDLSNLASSDDAVVSDIYPLYNKSSLRAGQASIEVHVTRSSVEEKLPPEKPQESNLDEEGLPATCENDAQSDEAEADRVKLRIVIDQALHLNLLPGDGFLFVTFTWNGREQKSNSEKSSASCVQWMHEKVVSLNQDQLHEVKDIVFKLWQETATGPRVLGFVSVDLTPLLHGLPELAGWYNVMDFSSLCQGQIKIGVFPLCPFNPDTASMAGVMKVNSTVDRRASPQAVRIAYCTSAVYDRFPEHIAQFSEQHVHANLSDSPHKPSVTHHDVHVSGVRRHHRAIRSSAGNSEEQLPEADGKKRHDDALQSQLRTALSELDDLTAALKQKLRCSSLSKTRHCLPDTPAQRFPDSADPARQISDCSHGAAAFTTVASGVAVEPTRTSREAKNDFDSSEEYGSGHPQWHAEAASRSGDLGTDEGDEDDIADDEIISADIRVINEHPRPPIASTFHVSKLAVTADASHAVARQLADDAAAVAPSSDIEPARPSCSGTNSITTVVAEACSRRLDDDVGGDGEETQSTAGCRVAPVPESHMSDGDGSPASDLWSESDAWSPGVSLAAYLNDDNGVGLLEADSTTPHSGRSDTVTLPNFGGGGESSDNSGGGVTSPEPRRQRTAPVRDDATDIDECTDIADDRGTSIWHGSQTHLDELSATTVSAAGRLHDDSYNDVAATGSRHDTAAVEGESLLLAARPGIGDAAGQSKNEPVAAGDASPPVGRLDTIAVDRSLTAVTDQRPPPGEPVVALVDTADSEMALPKHPTGEVPQPKGVHRGLPLRPSSSRSTGSGSADAAVDYHHRVRDRPVSAQVPQATFPAATTGHTQAPIAQTTPTPAAGQAGSPSLPNASSASFRSQGAAERRNSSCRMSDVPGADVVATGPAMACVDGGVPSPRAESESSGTRTTAAKSKNAAEERVSFFPTAAELESSMRAVRLASTASAAVQEDATAVATVDVTRFTRKPRPLALAVGLAPSSETTKRIARIFSTRFTSDPR